MGLLGFRKWVFLVETNEDGDEGFGLHIAIYS